MRDVIAIRTAVMSGTPCFAGTRVPVQTLLDYLEAGDAVDKFLTDFPSVQRDQAVRLLVLGVEQLVQCMK